MNYDPDLVFVIGIVLGFLAAPALIGAFSEGRPPRAAALLIMASIGLITLAVVKKPSGYSFSEAPAVFMQVVGRVIN